MKPRKGSKKSRVFSGKAERKSHAFKTSLKSLLSGIQAGSGETEMKKVPLRD